MAYTPRNLLQTIVDVQNITLEHQARGLPNSEIYKRYIFPQFRISVRTYYYWLSRPAKMELRKLENRTLKQLKLKL